MGKPSKRIIDSFTSDDEFSKSLYATEFWRRFYRDAFGDFVGMSGTSEDYAEQTCGIDRRVYRLNDITTLIDEKLRREFRSDFFLEYLSSDVANTPGWLNKKLDIDYIAYGWFPTQNAYLLEWQSLTSAWFKHGQDWLELYPRLPARNKDYTTWGVCVPTRVVTGLVDHIYKSFTYTDLAEEDLQLSMF